MNNSNTVIELNNSLPNNIVKFPNSKTNKRKTTHTNGKVETIKDIETIKNYRKAFLDEPQRYKNLNLNYRNYAIFVLGTNTGRRASDLLNLKIKDVLDDNGNIKTRLTIVEKKTKKIITIPLNEDARAALDRYIYTKEEINLEEYLFVSRKGNGKTPMETNSFRLIMKKVAKEMGTNLNIGTHTMRKTAGYQMYQNTHDIVAIQKAFNHSNAKITERYIGVEQDEINAVISSIDYGITD